MSQPYDIDPELYQRAVDLHKVRKARDRDTAFMAQGVRGDVRGGASIAGAVAAHKRPGPEGINADQKLKILEMLKDLDQGDVARKVAELKSSGDKAAARATLMDGIFGKLVDLAKTIVGAQADVVVKQLEGDMAKLTAIDKKMASAALIYPTTETDAYVEGVLTGPAGRALVQMAHGQQLPNQVVLEALQGLPADPVQRALALDGLEAAVNSESGGKPIDLRGWVGQQAAAGGDALNDGSKQLQRSIEGADAAYRNQLYLAEPTQKLQMDRVNLLDDMKKRYSMSLGNIGGDLIDLYKEILADEDLDPVEAARRVDSVTSGVSGEDLPEGAEGAEGEEPEADDESDVARRYTREQLQTMLEKDSPEPEVVARKRAIMASEEFKVFMEKRGLSDPDFAFKALMKEMRLKHRGNLQQDRENLRTGQVLGEAPVEPGQKPAAAAAPTPATPASVMGGAAETGRAASASKVGTPARDVGQLRTGGDPRGNVQAEVLGEVTPRSRATNARTVRAEPAMDREPADTKGMAYRDAATDEPEAEFEDLTGPKSFSYFGEGPTGRGQLNFNERLQLDDITDETVLRAQQDEGETDVSADPVPNETVLDAEKKLAEMRKQAVYDRLRSSPEM